MNGTTRKALIKGIIVFAALGALILFIRITGLNEIFDKAWIDAHIKGRGIWGYLSFLAIASGLTGLGFPRQAIGFLAGYAFGAIGGTLLSTLGCAIGCTVAFSYARLAGRATIQRRYGNRISKINTFLRRAPFQMSIIIRLLPVGNNLLTNLIGGVSTIPAQPFILGSTIGYTPQMFIFALLGSGIHVDPVWRTTLSAGLFVLSSLMGYRLFRRYRIEATLADA